MTEQIDPALAAVAEYDKARAVTEAAIQDYRAAIELGDFKFAEARFGEANAAQFAALNAALKTAPTTTDGAIAMMRLLGEHLDDLAEDPDHRPTLVAAIRAAADAIDGARGDAPTPVETSGEDHEALLNAYNCWLEWEQRELAQERSAGDPELFDGYYRNFVLIGHRAGSYHNGRRPPASSRAEFVLSAVGCDWRHLEAKQ